MECAQCGAPLTSGQNTCAKCGAAVARQYDFAVEDEIHRLLAEANLYRIRKQYDQAVAACTRVLRLDQANGTAHSLMGDIYRDEGNDREALGWYKLAVQLNPNSAADRKKLDETIDRVFQDTAQATQNTPSQPDSAFELLAPADEADTPASPLRERFRALLEKITPVHVVIGATVLAIVVMAIIVLWPVAEERHGKQGRDGQTTQTTPVGSQTNTDPNTQPSVNGALPQVTPPAPDGVEGTKIPGLPIIVVPNSDGKATTPATGGTNKATVPSRTPVPSNDTKVAQVPPFEPKPRVSLSAEELERETVQLRAALENALKESKLPSALVDVRIDPRSKEVTIDYNVPHMQGGPVETKQGLIYSGFQLIWAAERSDNSLRGYTLRGYAYPSTGGDLRSLALQADVSPQQAEDAKEAGDYRTVLKYMSHVWWRGDLEAAAL